MFAERIAWVAHLVEDTRSIQQAKAIGQALGFVTLIDDPDKIMFRTAGGDVVEYCTPQAEVPEHLFRQQETVAGYLVADIHQVAAALARAGVDAVTSVIDAGGVRFQHFAGIDGRIFALIQQQGAAGP